MNFSESDFTDCAVVETKLVKAPITREERAMIARMKFAHLPCNKTFYDKPHDTGMFTRRRTRPWDNCWFSNKPEIIVLTVEQAVKKHPQYMKWIYSNLSINWSVYSIQMLEVL